MDHYIASLLLFWPQGRSAAWFVANMHICMYVTSCARRRIAGVEVSMVFPGSAVRRIDQTLISSCLTCATLQHCDD